MSDSASSPTYAFPEPLPYHREIVAYLKEAEPELWRWASSAEVLGEYAQEIRSQLLKENYRLDCEGHPEFVNRCAEVASRLGVTTPVTLYQATGGIGMNAMLCHLPGEAHIVFMGPLLATLKGPELDAVLAHELAHHRLWEMDGGDFLVADRLLGGAAKDQRAAVSHIYTARRFRLYTEIFADRGSLAGCGQLEAAVAALVKSETGLPEVSPASYLRQAGEILRGENGATKGVEHPETFIRARALQLWFEQDSSLDEWITATIEGALALDDLDITGQLSLCRLTRRFLAELLRPRWFRSELALAHARAFFPDFALASAPDESLAEGLRFTDSVTREYLCYLLLDFAAIDPELEEAPLAAAIDWSHRLNMSEQFEKLALKEFGLGKRQFNKIKKTAATLLETLEKKS